MKIESLTKTYPVCICNHFWSRLKGNMGKKEINEVLLFPRCNSVHTFFMRTKIDVVMLSKDNIVLYIYPSVKPWRILWPKKHVHQILEFPDGENPFQIQDVIEFKKETNVSNLPS